MCKLKKRPSVLKYQSNFASKPATSVQRFKAVEFGSSVHERNILNVKITERTLLATMTLQKPQNWVSGVFTLTLVK